MAEEAYKAAGDANKYPEQLKFVSTWQPTRLVWNTFNFGATSQKPSDKGSFIQVNIGEYNPLLGKSYTEIAGESRSMHKSQGFGSAKNKGLRPEYLLHKEGIPATKDVFDEVNTSWSRVKGGLMVKEQIDEAIKNFKADQPESIIPNLLKAYSSLEKLDDAYWIDVKKKEIEKLIIACSGVFVEANAKDYAVANGEKFTIATNTIKRSTVGLTLTGIKISSQNEGEKLNESLQNNEIFVKSFDIEVPKDAPISQPYWLEQKPLKGIFQVDDLQMRGLPIKPSYFQASFSFLINDFNFTIQIPVTYKIVDPVKGEIYRPLEIRPSVAATLQEKVILFTDNKPKAVEVLLKSAVANANGELSLTLPRNWKSKPVSIPFELATKYQEQKAVFMVTPPSESTEDILKVSVNVAGKLEQKGLYPIAYDHIPNLIYFPDSEAKLIKLDLKTKGKKIGYIAGAGDDVPAALKQIGYEVTMLTDEELGKSFASYDAIVVGVRAYNTEERLKFAQKRLMEYVEAGGNMIVQYQTNFRTVTDEIGPYPIKLGRERVTVEEQTMTFLKPEHPILNTPNKITSKDFDNWIQERGLYFANTWDPNYQTIFACNDPNEKVQEGSFLITKYGKGNYIFTGLAFFRQLPAGVSGAYRLFANMISIGK